MRVEFLDFRQYPWGAVLDSADEIGSVTLELDSGALVARVTAEGATHYINEKLRVERSPTAEELAAGHRQGHRDSELRGRCAGPGIALSR